MTDQRSPLPLTGTANSPTGGFALLRWLSVVLMALTPTFAQASMFKGEALDTAADIMSWVVLVVAPITAIIVFWLVHILPEKIAEKRQHPQAKAIQVLCILSLFFGGLLWPLAWLLAYTKPVLHKLAYGTDKEPHADDHPSEASVASDDAAELQRLRQQVLELESRLDHSPEAGKA